MIDPNDIKIESYRTAEQKLNENARGVRITHLPTGRVHMSAEHKTYHENLRSATERLERELLITGL